MDGSEIALAQPANASFVTPKAAPISPDSQAVSFPPSGESEAQRLHSYLFRPNQMARTAGRQGFVSLVPVVANQRVNQSAYGMEVTEKVQQEELRTEQKLAENR